MLSPYRSDPGPLMAARFACVKCGQWKPQTGSSWLRRKGLPPLHFCAVCRPGKGAHL